MDDEIKLYCEKKGCGSRGYHRTFHKGKILCGKHHQELIDKVVKQETNTGDTQ